MVAIVLTSYPTFLISAPEADAYYNRWSDMDGYQNILADPFRPFTYWGDNATKTIYSYDYRTGTQASTYLGSDIRSLDISSDGSLMAVSSSSKVVIVDLDERTAGSSFPLSFEPRSVRFGLADSLIVSDSGSDLVQRFDLSGASLGAFHAGNSVALEAKGSVLLTFSMNSAANTVVTKYDLSSGSFVAAASNDQLGSYFSQAAVDWTNGTIYVACAAPSEIQAYSLTGLQKIGSFSIPSFPTGMALSRDMKIVYGASCHGAPYPEGSSSIYAYDVQSHELLSAIGIHRDIGPIGVVDDPTKVVVVSPFKLESLTIAAIQPLLPSSGSVYAYTPSYVTFNIGSFVPVTLDKVACTVDGMPYTVASLGENEYLVNITSALGTGTHTVTVVVHRGSWEVTRQWTFVIDPQRPGALAPSLTLIRPDINQSGFGDLYSIEVAYADQSPSPISHEITLFYNGVPLPTYQNPYNSKHYNATTPSAMSSYPAIQIAGEIALDTGDLYTYWNKSYSIGPNLYAESPMPSTYLATPPSTVKASLYLGNPSVTVYPDSLVVVLDGFVLKSVMPGPDSVVGDIGGVLSAGTHFVKVDLDTSAGHLVTEWNFTVAPSPDPGYDFVRTYHEQEYSILVPDTWQVSRDQPLGGGEYADLVIMGPDYIGITTNFIVESGTDPEARSDRSSMYAFANNTMALMVAQSHYGVGMIGEFNYTRIGGFPAGIWHMGLFGSDMLVQTMVLIVDENTGRQWAIVCTVAEGADDYVWPTFDKMISSFEAPHVMEEGRYTTYVREGDYSLLIPEDWRTREDWASGGITFSLSITGPTEDDFTVNVLLQNGTDPSIREDRSYLETQVEERFIQMLDDRGVEATIYEQPSFTTISNHSAMVLSIKWTNMPIIQKAAIIVDEEHHRYWIFTCSSAESTYGEYSEIFDTMIGSFNVTGSEEGNDLISGELSLVLLGGGTIALITVIGTSIFSQRRKM